MSGGGGGVHIIRPRLRTAAETSAIQEQLGALKLARLLAILAKQDDDWEISETQFVARCIKDAVDAYE